MVRFIFACMAFAVLSFALTPAYFGIKKEQQLNAIAPAAGDENEAAPQPEIFSNGFSGIALNSLAE